MKSKSIFSNRTLVVSLTILIVSTIGVIALERTTEASIVSQVAEFAENISGKLSQKPNKSKSPQLGGVDGRLLFARVNSSAQLTGRIGSMEPITNSATTTLTGEHEYEPAWSPDGKKVVFISMRDGIDLDWYPEERTNREIYIMNADGTDQRRLTFNTSPEANPIFSPDGTKILYVGMVGGDVFGEVGVFSMNIDGSGQTLLVDETCVPNFSPNDKAKKKRTDRSNFYPGFLGFDTPNYSPDMTNIIFGVSFGTDGVYRHTIGVPGCTFVASSANNSIEPRYSPDGTKIALNGYYASLDIVDANGNFLVGFDPPEYGYSTPVWSPDGSTIAYLGDFGNWGPQQIRTININTGDTSLLYSGSVDYFFNGLSWGNPSNAVPPITLKIVPNHSILGGQSTQGVVQMDPATFPAGGGSVSLSVVGTPGVLSLPQTNVTIPPGETSATFAINSLAQSTYTSADIVAEYSGDQARSTVTVRPPKADLSVTNVTAPANVTLGTAFSMSWTVQNLTTTSTVNGYRDQVFYSRDDQWDASDVLLSTVNNAALAGGASRTLTRSVTITAAMNPENGTNYILVVTNRTNSVDEGGNTNNNSLSRSLQLPLPDLVAESLVVPPNVEPGVAYTANFNIRNAGTVPTGQTTVVQIWFSEDNVAGNSDDVQVITDYTLPTLAGGATSPQTRTINIPTTPLRNSGPAYFYVKVDATNLIAEGASTGQLNNNTFAPTAFDYRVPDLQVPTSGAAADVDTDTAFPLSWTTTNAGNKATTANLVDRVWLSADQTVGGDVNLGDFILTGGLAIGASANRIQNITIPYANVPASGNFYLLIQTDATSLANEGVYEGNNVRIQPVYVRKALRPDLVVTNVTGPPTVFFDQTIQVQWTVTNNGTGPTNAPQWKDRLHIGTSPTSTSGASLLAESNSITALNPGESYTTSATVRIPRGISGAYRFIVTANSNGAVNEVSTTNNLLSSAVTVNVPPLPDLVVQSVSAPDVVFAGTPVSISYTIGNVGTAEAGYRKERIYLSRNTVLNTGEDKLIFTSDGTYGPAAGQSQTHTSRNRVGNQEPAVYQDVFLPSNLEGLWYVFVVTDYRNDTYEYSAENNNTGYDIAEPGSPMNILVTPPDLTVPNQPTAPTTIATGQSFNVDFMVRNQGAFNASPFLYHGIYLSADQTFSPGTDSLLGTFRDPVFFGPGDEHPISISTSLQACLPNGTYYLFAVADYNNHQFEFDPGYDAEANNASPFREIQVFTVPPDLQVTALSHSAVSMPGDNVTVNWTVANTGGTASGNWIDRVYLVSTDPQIGTLTLAAVQRTGGLPSGGSYSESRTVSLPAFMQGTYYFAVGTDTGTSVPECGTAENNNGAQGSNFNVTNNLPDLVVNSVTAPSSATVGDTFQVQWTGRNANQQMPANSSSWRDNVYLSSDTSLSGGDLYLGTALNTSILGANQTYLQQTNVTIGNVAPGTYYVLVYGDANRNIYEGTNASGFESNNVTASAPITLSVPAVDLTVGGVTLSTPHYSGTYRNVSWTVTNNGSTPTLTDAWTDYIYLSRDSILDPSDTQLGYRGRSGVLAGGANYVQTSSVFIPVGLTGAYTIFVVTDRNNSVVENNNSNNTSLPLSISLSVPPPAEMSITNIVPPVSMSVGGNATFTWTVQNTGANPVEGQWRDTVYLSRDQFWDASDTLVGIRDLNSQTTPLPASGTYTTSYGGAVPPIEEGTYYVIVRTDAQNRIREANEVNNVATSVGTTTITIQTLTLGTPFNTTLGNGAQMFFKYATTPAETLVFSLDTDINSRSNESFTKFGTMVSRADYDFQSSRPGEGDQENFIPATQAGDYYSMVRTDYIPEFFAENFDKSPKKSNNNLGTSVPDQNITVEAKILPFSIRSIEPETGGNSGYTTLLIKGAKFEQGANVKLVGPKGIEILPVMNRVATSKIAALFDLKSKSPGIYDVIVTNPGGATTQLADSFTITTGGGHQLSEFTQGPRFYRAGLGGRFRYTLSARNDGGNDAINVPFIIDIPQVNYELDRSNILDLPASALPPGIPLPLPTHYDIGDRRVIILLIPILRARTSANFRINLNIPTSLNSYSINSVTLPPLAEIFEAGFTQSDGQQNALALARLLKQRAPQAGIDNGCWAEFMRQLGFLILGQLLKRLDAVGDCGRFIAGLIAGVSDTISGGLLSYATGSQTDATGAAFTMSGVIGNFLSRIAGSGLDCAKNVIDTTIPPLEAFFLTISVGQLLYQLYQCIQPIGDEYEAFGLGSFDPNEKIGPAGYGGERFVPDRAPMLYRINFENLASATAPAQRIFVTDQLPLTLDPRTVRIKEIGFKQQQIIVPDNQASYQARLQLGEDLNNLQVDVLAGLDLVNRRVFWSLQAIDPATGEEPLDPTLGLLPPNNSNRDGEGYVTFTIEPTAAQPTRTDLVNNATIVFDTNEAIITNTVSNLLDSGIPTSQLAPLPPTSTVPIFDLSWAGTDDATGSGLKGIDVLYSDDGSTYSPFVLNSQANNIEFAGKWGKLYRFHTRARDNAGNIEAAPIIPDATIQVFGGDTESDVAPRPNGSDGSLNADDLAQVRRFVAGLDTDFLYNELQRADSSPRNDGGDGALTVSDVMQARRFAAGLDPTPEALGPNEPASFSPKTINGRSAGLLPREVKPITIIRNGNQIEVGIVLETQGDETGLGFGLNFDPAVLSNPVATLRPIASGGTLTVNTAQVATGKLGIMLDKAPNQPFTAGSNVVMTIVFDIANGSPATTQITFGDDPIKREVVDGLANSLTTTFSPGTIQLLGPTSASVSISGRVLKADGTPIKGARLILSGNQTGRTTTISNPFGYFTFNDVASGQTYTISTTARGYTFTPRSIMVTDEILGLEITPDP